MKKRQGAVTAVVALLVLILLAASLYLGIAAIASRKMAQGEISLSNGEFAKALISFRDAERFNNYIMRKDPRVIEGFAESYFGLDDLVSALEYYLRIAAADPDNAKTAYMLGLIYIKEKNFDMAGQQIKTLENLRTYEAKDYAEELSRLLRENSLKGTLQDLYDRFAPNIPKIPGLNDKLDALKERLAPNSDEKKEDSEQRDSIPDTGETENKKGNGAEVTI